MGEPKMPQEARDEWFAEESRHVRAFSTFINRWPNFRMHAAYALLGGAIATVDMMGGDADGFIESLRKVAPRPNPIVPPGGS